MMTVEYNDMIADAFCELLADGMSIRQICHHKKGDSNFPSRSTVLRWFEQYPDFEAKCARARLMQGDENFDRVGETIDKVERGELAPDVARVVISGLQWRASKLQPKKYGDKSTHEHTGKDGLELKTNDVTVKVLSMLSTEQLEALKEETEE